MNEPANKQDLYNQEIQFNSNFDKVISQFDMFRTNMDSQFKQTRAEMLDQFSKVFAMFDTMQVEMNKSLYKFGAFLITTMIAILSLDRWWL